MLYLNFIVIWLKPLYLFILSFFHDNYFFSFSYQDANNRALFCYTASLKWLGIRLDSLSSVLVTVVTLAAIFLSGDTGK